MSGKKVLFDSNIIHHLHPIKKNRRQLAKYIYQIRSQVQMSGGVSDNDLTQFVENYQSKKDRKK